MLSLCSNPRSCFPASLRGVKEAVNAGMSVTFSAPAMLLMDLHFIVFVTTWNETHKSLDTFLTVIKSGGQST